jgi:hypothetical protein
VAKNMIPLMGSQENYYDKIDWVNKCIIRERNTDLFMLSFSPDDYRPNDPQWYEKHRRDADKAAERLSKPGVSLLVPLEMQHFWHSCFRAPKRWSKEPRWTRLLQSRHTMQ